MNVKHYFREFYTRNVYERKKCNLNKYSLYCFKLVSHHSQLPNLLIVIVVSILIEKYNNKKNIFKL